MVKLFKLCKNPLKAAEKQWRLVGQLGKLQKKLFLVIESHFRIIFISFLKIDISSLNIVNKDIQRYFTLDDLLNNSKYFRL